ncbi:MAG TPA: helix-turn-helix domain-containing protein [Acidimicrobiales bacterium]
MAGGASAQRARRYRSPKRQDQARRTRRQILEAAGTQFRSFGYAGTTMSAIAAAAGVSVPTVELAFSTKAALLKGAIDVAIAGDDEPIPILQRPWATQSQETSAAEQFLAGVADVLVASAQRADALVLAAFEAARADQRLAPLAAQLKAQRTTTAAWIVDGIAARSELRTDRAQAIDIVWLLMDPALFERLTADRGWTAQRYGAWFADSALRLLTES